MAEIKIDWNLDSSERLTEEIKASEKNISAVKIGEYLLEQFKTDNKLKTKYKENKVTLVSVWNRVMLNAKNKLNSKNGYIEPDIVYGWAIDKILNVKPEKITKEKVLTLDIKTQEDLRKQAEEDFKKSEIRKLQKEAEQVEREKESAEREFQKKQKEKRDAKKQKENEKLEKIKKEGQISLW